MIDEKGGRRRLTQDRVSRGIQRPAESSTDGRSPVSSDRHGCGCRHGTTTDHADVSPDSKSSVKILIPHTQKIARPALASVM